MRQLKFTTLKLVLPLFYFLVLARCLIYLTPIGLVYLSPANAYFQIPFSVDEHQRPRQQDDSAPVHGRIRRAKLPGSPQLCRRTDAPGKP